MFCRKLQKKHPKNGKYYEKGKLIKCNKPPPVTVTPPAPILILLPSSMTTFSIVRNVIFNFSSFRSPSPCCLIPQRQGHHPLQLQLVRLYRKHKICDIQTEKQKRKHENCLWRNFHIFNFLLLFSWCPDVARISFTLMLCSLVATGNARIVFVSQCDAIHIRECNARTCLCDGYTVTTTWQDDEREDIYGHPHDNL